MCGVKDVDRRGSPVAGPKCDCASMGARGWAIPFFCAAPTLVRKAMFERSSRRFARPKSPFMPNSKPEQQGLARNQVLSSNVRASCRWTQPREHRDGVEGKEYFEGAGRCCPLSAPPSCCTLSSRCARRDARGGDDRPHCCRSQLAACYILRSDCHPSLSCLHGLHSLSLSLFFSNRSFRSLRRRNGRRMIRLRRRRASISPSRWRIAHGSY